GASRRSSVFGLNASPSRAIVFPRSLPRCFSSFPTTRRFWSSFTSITAFSSWKWYPELDASCFKAIPSLGKQEPPQPIPARRKCGNRLGRLLLPQGRDRLEAARVQLRVPLPAAERRDRGERAPEAARG